VRKPTGHRVLEARAREMLSEHALLEEARGEVRSTRPPRLGKVIVVVEGKDEGRMWRWIKVPRASDSGSSHEGRLSMTMTGEHGASAAELSTQMEATPMRAFPSPVLASSWPPDWENTF
jgi:hypothetical protein